jgi:glucosylceramidase
VTLASRFSIAHDRRYILPVLRQALRLDPGTTVMATPWSPPGWMKTSGSMIGGTLRAPDYPVFARYLVRFLRAYRTAGVPVSLISSQNEPEFSPSNYPGSTLTAAQEGRFIARDLGPAIAAAGLPTKILAYDHNWNDPAYPEKILGDRAAARYVAGTAWHCYAGDPSAQTTVHDAYPAKGTYFTECSGSQSANPASTFANSLDWQTEHLIIDATRDWAKSVTTWNLALNPSGGPSMNCTTCTALVTVDNAAGTAAYNAEYYVLGQASKFVRPGAVRIASGSFGPSSIEDVAFRNREGSTALIAVNTASSRQTFGVTSRGSSFPDSLPSGAVATFTW